MFEILGRVTPVFGRARALALRKSCGRARQPIVQTLEPRALLAPYFLPSGANTTAIAVSTDGSVVVGNVINQASGGPFRWTQSSGPVLLLDSAGHILGDTYLATDVSGDGFTIVGSDTSTDGQAFRWAGGVAATIPELGSPITSTASSVSANGSIIAGDISTSSQSGGYWLSGSNLEIISAPNPNQTVAVTAMSADGSVVAGNLGGGSGTSIAFQWNSGSGSLTQLPGNSGLNSQATAVSPDGSVVVGGKVVSSNGPTVPFEWTNGMVTTLALPAGFVYGTATGVSNDGGPFVGYMAATNNDFYNNKTVAFIWTQSGGIQDLEQVLSNSDGLGSSLAKWTLTQATAITSDENVIVGNGIDPQGQEEGWIANLSTTKQQQQTMITWPAPAEMVYGATLGAAQLDATADVTGTFTYSPPFGTLLHAGSGQTLSVTFTPSDTTDYMSATEMVPIDVLRAMPAIQWANPADIVYGTPLGTTELDATASYTVGGVSVSVPGTFIYSPPDHDVLMAGPNQTQLVTFIPTDTTDYTNATATAVINVLPGPEPPRRVYHTETILARSPAPRTWVKRSP